MIYSKKPSCEKVVQLEKGWVKKLRNQRWQPRNGCNINGNNNNATEYYQKFLNLKKEVGILLC